MKVNAPLFDHTNTGTTHYAARLNGTAHERYGLAKSLSVMPGGLRVSAKELFMTTKNLLFFLVIYFVSNLASGQVTANEDVGFKAKLLTLSRFGLLDSKMLLDELENQKVDFIHDTSEILILKVYSSKKFFLGTNQHYVDWIGDCNFFLAYNRRNYTFYRLGGFQTLDLRSFFEDMNSSDLISILESQTVNLHLDIPCLLKCSKKSKSNTGYECKCNVICSDELKQLKR